MPNRYPSLAGQTAIVTGGASGIGATIVADLVAEGAKVGFLDIDTAAGEALAGALGAAVRFEAVDIRDIEAVQAAIERLRAALGPITILVNNAARDDRHTIDQVTPAYWRDRMAINLDHQFFASQAVWRDMAAAGGGAIVNMSSTSYLASHSSMVAYKTAKSAAIGLTRALARELGGHNIRVNAILPGWIMTPRQIEKWLTPEGEADLLARQCLKRKLVPADISRTVLFLASDDASAITAQAIIVDGGWV